MENQVFSKIIGHQQNLDFLQATVNSGRLAQAYLFFGAERLGKQYIARQLIASFLKTSELTTHPDFFLVQRQESEKTGDLKHEISVDQIRTLKDRLQQSSWLGNKKFALINEAENLSASAANALLKLLEEPPANTHLFLIASSKYRLPKTVLSRTTSVRFGLVGYKTMIEAGLGKIAAAYSLGRPGLALEFDQDGGKKLIETLADFGELVNAPVWRRANLINAWFSKKSSHVLQEEIFKERINIWKTALRLRLLTSQGLEGLVDSEILRENIANSLSVPETHQRLLGLSRVQRGFEYNGNLRLLLENLFLKN
ncbi:MAG: hypothetical protein V1821_03230 [bacterium]